MTQLEFEKALLINKSELLNHPIYNSLKSMEEVQRFMETHLFAVWDFMSLLKSLQNSLSCTSIPWFAPKHTKAARLINEIVLGEETDIDRDGTPISHFELYCKAMKKAGASTELFEVFQSRWDYQKTPIENIEQATLPTHIKDFLKFTFEVIETDKPHITASVFTYGRETIIPEMFVQLLEDLKTTESDLDQLEELQYYFQRHIELDGDEHGPMAFEMLSLLCDTPQKWEEAQIYANKAIKKRAELWNAICVDLHSTLQVN
jgi:hypothetical protein